MWCILWVVVTLVLLAVSNWYGYKWGIEWAIAEVDKEMSKRTSPTEKLMSLTREIVSKSNTRENAGPLRSYHAKRPHSE